MYRNVIANNPQKTARDGAGDCSAMLDMAQSAEENVTPQNDVTRKNTPMHTRR
jgi:hypothetical protein